MGVQPLRLFPARIAVGELTPSRARDAGPTRVLAYQPGIFPRSEEVVAATRGLDRGRVAPDAVEEAFRRDLAEFVRLQQDAGLDFFSDGLLRWPDIFRPLIEGSGVLRPGSLVRWFDNNAFFRAPQVTGPLGPSALPAAIVPDGAVPRPRVATLPSPYMFSRVARGAADRNQLMCDLARHVLRPAVAALAASGCQLIHLQEPWLAYFGIEPADWTPLEESLAALRDGLSTPIVLQTYFGDAGPFAQRLRHLPVDAVGIDLVETDVDALGTDWEIGLVAGCLDGRRSLVESLDATVDLARGLAETVRPPRLYLSASCDLELLPREVAQRKVRHLGEAAARVRELLPV